MRLEQTGGVIDQVTMFGQDVHLDANLIHKVADKSVNRVFAASSRRSRIPWV
jgi:hypothetical protein